MAFQDALIRLCLSFVLGMMIGYEREARRKIAGLKTHTLVCVGSCLIMMISTSMGIFESTDSSRIAAQVVSGIGFLGAGTILREGTSVIGLTTAANLWVVSAVGMAVGRGIFAEAFITVGLVMIALVFFPDFEKWHRSKAELCMTLVSVDQVGQTGKIGCLLGDMGVDIRDIRIEENSDNTLKFHLRLCSGKNISEELIIKQLSKIEGIITIKKQ